MNDIIIIDGKAIVNCKMIQQCYVNDNYDTMQKYLPTGGKVVSNVDESHVNRDTERENGRERKVEVTFDSVQQATQREKVISL